MFLATHGILRSGGVEAIPFTDTHSFDYDGLNDYVEISNPSAFYNTGDFSLSVWVKYTSTLSSRNIINLVDNKAVYISGGKLLGFFRNSGGSFKSISTSLNYNDGNWHNLVFTKDNTNLTLYVDGYQVAQNSLGGVGQSGGTANARLGARSLSSPSNYFIGKSDEPAYFDYKLTSSDVTNIYGLGYPTDLAPLTPVGWWRAENATWNGSSFDIVDSGSGGNDAETNNMVEADRTTDVPLFDNKSFEYDGVNDYLDCGDSNNLSFGDGINDSPFSISAWVKMVDATKFRIASKYGTSGIEYILATGGTDLLTFNTYDNSNSSRIGRQFSTPLTSLENQWVHIVGTYSGNQNVGSFKIYIDGVRVDDTNSSVGSYIAMENTSQGFEIGKMTTSFTEGKINEPAIFDYELTSSQVSSIYGSGIATDISNLNPVSLWREESGSWDGSKWTITDSGSGGNDAESISMTLASRSSDVPT